ncbi:O-antigen ligase-like membrane protein [Winogradskyella wandonensis]|uniref:O-antigen ligase-like membrane protein n=1 Tax=Winogradskyella wandonensis TaxID=1442586 RepID=A0A4V2PTU1_9FLAO|nr:O-antigen ligase family protein [Winogradskyella wandonensis]TCK67811.1 O-antigen ligase-like membrane protein [Winogradskyella wandonensis]
MILKDTNIIKIDKAIKTMVLLISFSLPVSEKLCSVFIGLTTILLIFKGRFLKLPKHYLLFVLVFFALLFHFLNETGFDLKIFERRLSFLILPFIIVNAQVVKHKIYKAFIIGTISSYLILMGIAFFKFIENGYSFVSRGCITCTWFNSIPKSANFLFHSQFTEYTHHSYFGVLVTLSLLLLYFVRNNFSKKRLYLFAIVLVLALFQSFSLVSFIIAGSILMLIILKKPLGKLIRNLQVLVITFQALVVLAFFLISSISTDNRLFLWKSSTELIKENRFIGVGIIKVKKQLYQYTEHKEKIKGFNAHNQYLQYILEYGLLPFLVLGYFYIKEVGLIKKREYQLIGAVFLLFGFVESFLARALGIMMFSFFYSIIYKFKNNEEHY